MPKIPKITFSNMLIVFPTFRIIMRHPGVADQVEPRSWRRDSHFAYLISYLYNSRLSERDTFQDCRRRSTKSSIQQIVWLEHLWLTWMVAMGKQSGEYLVVLVFFTPCVPEGVRSDHAMLKYTRPSLKHANSPALVRSASPCGGQGLIQPHLEILTVLTKSSCDLSQYSPIFHRVARI